MTSVINDYMQYFNEEQQARIGIKLADDKFLDVSGLIRFIEGDRLTLELIGTAPIEETAVTPGVDVIITTWTEWSLCRCSAVLMQKIHGRLVLLRLTGQVIEKQSREYFRLDVSIPLYYTIPEQQLLQAVQEEWVVSREFMLGLPDPVLQPCPDGLKVVRWNGGSDIMTQTVNLSGGGLRFKTPEYVKPETLVAISLFLPLIPPLVIHAVAETRRCSEIMVVRGRGDSYITALRLHFITDKDRETIIAFIFAEQRRMLSARIDKRL